MTRAPADRRPHDAKIIGALSEVATKLGGQLKSGASMKGTVLVFDNTLEVEITMVVRPKPTRDARETHIVEAMRLLVLEPYRDSCNAHVKSRRGMACAPRSCSKSPTYVSVTKSSRLFGGEPEHYYSMICTAHAKADRGGVAVIAITADRLKVTRAEIKARAEQKARLDAMTPEERVVEDAIAAKRPAAEIAELVAQIPTIGTTDAAGVFHCKCGASHHRGPLGGVGIAPPNPRYRCVKCGAAGRATRAIAAVDPGSPVNDGAQPRDRFTKLDPRIFE